MDDGHRPGPDSAEQGDIEEVLDSIRRLVAQRPAGAVAAAGATRSRLILTPAFRVDRPLPAAHLRPVTPQPPAQCLDDAAPLMLGAASRTHDETAAPRAASATAPMLLVRPQIQPEPQGQPDLVAGDSTSGTQAWPGEEEPPEAIADRAAAAAARVADQAAALAALRRAVAQPANAPAQAAPSQAVPSEDANSDFRAEADMAEADDARTEALERTIAQLEAVIAASAQDWDPDGSETAHTSPADPLHAEMAPPANSPPQPAAAHVFPVTGASPAAAPSAPFDGQGDGSARALSMPEADVAAPESAAAASVAPETSPRDGEEEDATVILDEAMLREIVAKVLREELQGPLGERITRNVRKMVRREIARALSERSVN